MTSGSLASLRDLLAGDGGTTAATMILRLFCFCSAANQQKKGGKKVSGSVNRRTNRNRERDDRGEQRRPHHHGGRGFGRHLDGGREVVQVERLHLALVLLHRPLPRRLVRRHPLLRHRRHLPFSSNLTLLPCPLDSFD
jgi:hypothetical protein